MRIRVRVSLTILEDAQLTESRVHQTDLARLVHPRPRSTAPAAESLDKFPRLGSSLLLQPGCHH